MSDDASTKAFFSGCSGGWLPEPSTGLSMGRLTYESVFADKPLMLLPKTKKDFKDVFLSFYDCRKVCLGLHRGPSSQLTVESDEEAFAKILLDLVSSYRGGSEIPATVTPVTVEELDDEVDDQVEEEVDEVDDQVEEEVEVRPKGKSKWKSDKSSSKSKSDKSDKSKSKSKSKRKKTEVCQLLEGWGVSHVEGKRIRRPALKSNFF